MNWNQALENITQHIFVGLDLNPDLQFREVVSGPDYPCFTYEYKGENGYKVQIGVNQFIEIPLTMLETLFEASIMNGGIYNNRVFLNNYERQYNNHGCHVHVVGKIFEKAGVAMQQGDNFIIQ